MSYPPQFNQQFLDDDGTPLAEGYLYTYVAGTTTGQTTYSDPDLGSTNTNPIELDAAGRCDLFLTPNLEYDLVLKRSDFSSVKTFESVVGAASTADVATSVNGDTGAVVLTSEDIAHTTGTSTTWYDGATVGAGLDAVITHIDEVGYRGVPASKPASTSRTLTTTMADDPDLTVALGVGRYSIQMYLPLFSTGTGQGQFKFQFTFSGTQTSIITSAHGRIAGSAVTYATVTAASTSTAVAASIAATDWLRVDGAITVTVAGSLTLQWAQNTSHADATIVGIGSWLTCLPVS